MLHITQVENTGLASDCVCAECREPLIAYVYTVKRVQYFGHTSGRVCANAAETALHRYAKQVVCEALRIQCPRVVLDDGRQTRVKTAKMVTLHEAAQEVRLGPLIVDVLAHVAGSSEARKPLVIEIAVTHESEPEKIETLEQRKIAGIEIDLSELAYESSVEDIRAAVLETAPRRWLFNPLQAQALVLKQVNLRARAEENARPVLALLEQRQPVYKQDTAEMRAAIRKVAAFKLSDLINLPIRGDAVFAYSRRGWQATVLCRIVEDGIPEQAFYLLQLGLARPEVDVLTDAGMAVVRETYPDFQLLDGVVERYLEELGARGFRDDERERRTDLIAEAQRNRLAARIAEARVELEKRVRPLINRLPDEAREAFDFAAWCDTKIGRHTPLEKMLTSPSTRKDMLWGLAQLKNLFETSAQLPSNLLGLPLDALWAQRHAEIKERESEWLVALCNRRVESLKREALARGLDAVWVDKPNPALSGMRPCDVAWGSDGGLENAREALDATFDAPEDGSSVADDAMSVLKDVAYELAGSTALLEQTAFGPKKMKASDFCVDRETLKICVGKLEYLVRKPISATLQDKVAKVASGRMRPRPPG